MTIFGEHLRRPGGLIGLGAIETEDLDDALLEEVVRVWGRARWRDVHRLAYARSKDLFERSGSGEQVFGAPGANATYALLDDVATSEPLFDCAVIVLQTSSKSFQHLYFFDRAISDEERASLQRFLVAEAQKRGLGGDPAATGGRQPHRVPGSINYKPGRGLFITRIARILTSVDGVEPLRTDHFLAKSESAKIFNRNFDRTHRASRHIRAHHKSESERDWHFACDFVEKNRLKYPNREYLAHEVERALIDRAFARRGADAYRYARITVEKMISLGKI